MERYGIDIGRVIIGPQLNGVADTSFLGSSLEAAMQTPPALNAFRVIKRLNTNNNVWLVSKCGSSVQKKTRAWLEHHNFEGRTGVKVSNLRFCLERREKAPIARQLNLTTFIDDRLDVLEHLRGVVPKLIWFGEDSLDYDPSNERLGGGWVTPARDWEEVEKLLCS